MRETAAPATSSAYEANPVPKPALGYWPSVWRRYRRHRSGMIGLCTFALLLLVAALGPMLAGGEPLVCKYEGRICFPAVVRTFHKIPFADKVYAMPKPFRFPQFVAKEEVPLDKAGWAVWPPVPWDPNETDPGNRLTAPSATHRLGTDELGRDVLSRLIHGTSVAMLVGFISMGIATLIGLTLGSLAGYFGGRTDLVISRIVELFICVPVFYVILILLQVTTKPSIYATMAVIGLFSWTGICRYVRGEFLRLRALDYAMAAKALGATTGRIIFRHLLPNALAPVLIVVAFGVAGAIFVESGLSWLGFGVMPPTPTWGNLLRAGWDNIRNMPSLIFPPSVAIFVAVLTFNLIGDAIRDVTDPRLTGST
jgi:peptide/nickel transport system permease protein